MHECIYKTQLKVKKRFKKNLLTGILLQIFNQSKGWIQRLVENTTLQGEIEFQ